MKVYRVFSESGYILHSRPYRETSVLLDIFTSRYGRISLVARGLKKPGSKKQPALESFIHYEFSWLGSDRSDLYTMTQAENQGNGYIYLPRQLCCGLYLNELLYRVLQKEDPHPELFTAYQTMLGCLASHADSPVLSSWIEINLRLFEKSLLQNLGYGFAFDRIDENKFYLFKNADGLISVDRQTISSISGESLLAFYHHALELKHLPDIKKLMRAALLPLIGDKPLKSRELFL